jgi:hypothetical protein
MRSPMGNQPSCRNNGNECAFLSVSRINRAALFCNFKILSKFFWQVFPRQHSNSLLLVELDNGRKPSLPEMVENVLSDEKYQVAVRLFCTKCQCGYSRYVVWYVATSDFNEWRENFKHLKSLPIKLLYSPQKCEIWSSLKLASFISLERA